MRRIVRHLLHGVAAAGLLVAAIPAVARPQDGAAWIGTVDPSSRARGVFPTIAAALAAAPAGRPVALRLAPGRHREKLSVDRPDVILLGAGRDATVITWADHADTPAPDGGTLGTRGSWTVRVTAPGFRAARLTIENAFDYIANARRAAGDPAKARNPQAVALALVAGSDRATLDDVALLGHQDTFLADAGRTVVRRSRVVGSVDFVFGAGTVVFDSCDVVSRDRGDPTNNGYVVAPSTDAATPIGFLFVRSRLLKESPAIAPNSVALGRPWHPSASPSAIGSAVFVDTWMDDHVGARGWDRMSSVEPASGERLWFEPEAARFFEVGSRGPGAVRAPTRRVLGPGDARSYTVERALRGWVPPASLADSSSSPR